MKKLFLLGACCIPMVIEAQNAITSNFIEGSKTLVELIKVIRAPKVTSTATTTVVFDSCSSKKVGDLSFMNRTDKQIKLQLFLRVGNEYSKTALTLTLGPQNQESFYDLKAGIYKYKVETDAGSGKTETLHEGELRLQPCDKLIKEIRLTK